MSRTALLERLYDVFNRQAWDEGRELLPEDFVYHPPAQSLHPEPVAGYEPLRAFLEPDLFERQSVDVLALRENGDLVLAEVTARGVMGGSELQQPAFQVWRFEADVPRELRVFTDRADAERAAGFSDPGR